MRLTILYRYLTITLIGLLNSSLTFGQLTEIQNSYANYNRYDLQEKIFVHTDRSFYLCGEVLWFKAYITNAVNNQPLSISKVSYVELLDKNYQPVFQAKIEMKDGTGSGSFFLPFSMASGNYELRAYTNWMKNFSADHYFKKIVTIINTTKNLDSAAVHKSINYRANFFPEGGDLINGLQSEIAFKITDNENRGVDAEGVIVDQLNDTITSFKSFLFGMGHFYLNPEAGKNYTAIINCRNGYTIRENLPKASPSGYVMHVRDTSANDVKITINTSGLSGDISNFIYLIIQNKGQINDASMLNIDNGKAIFIISKDSLKDGVSQITIFDSNKQPKCERLYFKRPKNKMVITAGADKNNYQLRSEVVIKISAKDQLQNLLKGNLSASVYRLDSLHQPDKENIFNYLWLSSELQGNVEDADYYFKNENPESDTAVDNLMLAQGWRKFGRKNVLQDKMPAFKYFPEYSGHIITGRITYRDTKKPVPNILVYLSVPGRRIQLKGCLSDSAGFVHFDMKNFIGANQIVMQTNRVDDNLFHLEIFTPFSEEYSANMIPDFHISEIESDHLQEDNFHMQVENAYHQKDLQKLQTPNVDSLPFYYKPYKTYMLDDYTRFTTMEEVLREYVTEISPRRKGTQYRLTTLNEPGFRLQDKQTVVQVFENNPLVLLDGVPVFDINKIIAYDPLKVQKLEVVAEKYFWGPIKAEGIASFTTYKGNLDGFTLDPKDLILDYDGLQQQRIFYSPDYSSEKELQSRLPDFRDLLYWSPDINTDEKGNTHISFFTGDVPGKYWVEIQGISSNGNAGNAGFILNVTK